MVRVLNAPNNWQTNRNALLPVSCWFKFSLLSGSLWVLSLFVGMFVSSSCKLQPAHGRAAAGRGPLQGKIRPEPSSFTQILVFCKRFCCSVCLADSFVVQSSMETCHSKAEQENSFGSLPMDLPIDFLCRILFFFPSLPSAAQSTSLKEAQEIFKSKQWKTYYLPQRPTTALKGKPALIMYLSNCMLCI